MNILDKYNLTVGVKIITHFGGKNLGLKHLVVDCTVKESNNIVLNFLSHLDRGDIEDFIEDIDLCLEHQNNGMGGFNTDSVEFLAYGILYDYPNVIVDNILTLPLQDMKDILEELLKYF